jgi:phospholipid/cholesterol/gamma-HCH transport system ATP-binding protein
MVGEISDAIIRVRDITVQFGKTRILDGLNLDVKRGEILGFVGPSGAGKSVLTRTIIGLVPKVAGRIEVFGVDLDKANSTERRGVERRWGVLFQQGALFSSLTVRQNIQFPVREYLNVSQRRARSRSIPNWCSWTSRPRASTRSAPATSTSWSAPCSVLWG